LCKEANLKRHEEADADASVTLLPGNSHFVRFAERDQIICLMRGTDRTRDAIA